MRSFRGDTSAWDRADSKPEVQVCYELATGAVRLKMHNSGTAVGRVMVKANAYRNDDPRTLVVGPGATVQHHWNLDESGHWYDFTVSADNFERRFAGRVETGKHGVSDPAMALHMTV